MGIVRIWPIAVVASTSFASTHSQVCILDQFQTLILDESGYEARLDALAKKDGYHPVQLRPDGFRSGDPIPESLIGQSVLLSHSIAPFGTAHAAERTLLQVSGVVVRQTPELIEVLGSGGKTLELRHRYYPIEKLYSKPGVKLTSISEDIVRFGKLPPAGSQILLKLPTDSGGSVWILGQVSQSADGLIHIEDPGRLTHAISLKTLKEDFPNGGYSFFQVEGAPSVLLDKRSALKSRYRNLQTREQLATSAGHFKKQPLSHDLFEEWKTRREALRLEPSGSIYLEKGKDFLGPILLLPKTYLPHLKPGTVLWNKAGRRLVTGVHDAVIETYADFQLGLRPDPTRLPETAWTKIYPTQVARVLDQQLIRNQELEKLKEVPSTARVFDLHDVLSVITNRVRGDRIITDVFAEDHPIESYKTTLGFLVRDGQMDIVGALGEYERAKRLLFKQYPELLKIELPPGLENPNTYKRWYQEQEKWIGKELVLLPLPKRAISLEERLARNEALIKSINPNIEFFEFTVPTDLNRLTRKLEANVGPGLDPDVPFSNQEFTQVFRESLLGASLSNEEWRPVQGVFETALKRLPSHRGRIRVLDWMTRSRGSERVSDFLFELLAQERDRKLNPDLLEQLIGKYVR